MQILRLDSSIQGDGSSSRALTQAVVSDLLKSLPDAISIYRDLVEEAIPHLDGPIGAGFRPLAFTEFDAVTRSEHTRSDALLAELVASDIVVIGAPMYNFSIPSQLKAWLDRVIQPGKTFRYTETGPVGLVSGKKVVIISTRGGSYLAGPLTPLDFQENYLKAALGFMGIKDVQFLRAENMSRGEDARRNSMENAVSAVSPLVSALLAA
ncbi:FMN-dependent NADH-azoreductase [Agrobacterium rhizogenes]|uniref:FMN-dependent NADH-azoreductase n=1 Tax=Rhizobium rhizogenes TaxID=359 RepID=UPI000648BA36|nr:FMN-dependent NADH-azoreductase [Rhizobium rhizogenes]OCJ23635.1 FMN-dependent NADH-azoreductase [Agrobacterium sp. B133/95]NTI51032.1 FMN-dependent NADH-azoreductase [Rhizobium rhizogenes]NTI96404.1 FMN-dependent NADH-azoreductase [Rhizobium rhizogenes]NTJ60540.1 FMN-dependent NADH-azoreductase [Rhizobium rhizogenes]QRM40674.1 FMN-dependent NADH-azoreductase [Rhizobium rhizogenes]